MYKVVIFIISLILISCTKINDLPKVEPNKIVITLWQKDGATAWNTAIYKLTNDIKYIFETNITTNNGRLIRTNIITNQIIVSNFTKDVFTMADEFTNAYKNGNPPDLFCAPNDKIGLLQYKNMIINIEAFYPEVMSKIDSNFMDVTYIEGYYYAIPIAYGNNLTLIYNKNMMSNTYGIAPENYVPDSFDRIISLTNFYNDNIRFPLVFNEAEPFWLILFYGAWNGQIFQTLGSSKATLENDAMIESLKFVRELRTNNIVPTNALLITNKNNNSGIITNRFDYNNAFIMFTNEQAACYIDGPWAWKNITNIMGDKVGFTVIPYITGAFYPKPLYGTIALAILSDINDIKSYKKKAVKMFIDILLSDEFMVSYAKETSQVPATKSAQTNSEILADTLIQVCAKQAKPQYGNPMPSHLALQFVWEAAAKYLPLFIYSNATAEDTAKNMNEYANTKIKQLLKSPNK